MNDIHDYILVISIFLFILVYAGGITIDSFKNNK